MGFFKELIEAAKEGYEEGKEEAAQEEAAKEQAETQEENAFKEKIAAIPYDEKFGTALAAPFRTDIFMDWFSVFKSTKEDLQEDLIPFHLYSFGGDIEYSDIDLKRMKQSLEDSFDITDYDSAISTIGDLFELARIPTKFDFPPSQDLTNEDRENHAFALAVLNDHMNKEVPAAGLYALMVAMVTICITASTDLGYLDKSTAVELLRDVNTYVKSMYKGEGSFEKYGEDFLAGEAFVGLNKKKGRKQLEQHVANLNFKAGSPWKNIDFNRDEDELFDFDEQVNKANMGVEVYMLSEEDMDALENHYEKYFGKIKNIMHEILSPDIHIDVAVLEPTDTKPYYTLITEGFSSYKMNSPEEDLSRAELMINLPADWKLDDEDEKWYWPMRALKALPRYALNQKTWLGWGHSIPTGMPIYEGSDFTGFLLLDPIDGEEECGTATLPGGSSVHIYQLLPVTSDEMEYKIEHETSELVDKLLEKNEFSSINVVDVDRLILT